MRSYCSSAIEWRLWVDLERELMMQNIELLKERIICDGQKKETKNGV